MKSTENIFHVVIFIILCKVALAFEWRNPEGRPKKWPFKWKPIIAVWLPCGTFCYVISFPLDVSTKSFVHLIPCLSITFSNWVILWQLDGWSYNLQTKVIILNYLWSWSSSFNHLSSSLFFYPLQFLFPLFPPLSFFFEACLVSTYSCHMKKIMI